MARQAILQQDRSIPHTAGLHTLGLGAEHGAYSTNVGTLLRSVGPP